MFHGITCADLYDRSVAAFHQNTAILFKDEKYTYDELQKNAYSLANALNKLGLKKGDRVAFLMANCPEYIFCEYALGKLGLVRVPLAVLLSSKDHIYMMNQSGCKALIYHERLAARVKEMIPSLETVRKFICVAQDPAIVTAGHEHLQGLINQNTPDTPHVELNCEDLVGIYYTGGTTGLPKGVMMSHNTWVGTFISEMLHLGLDWDEVFAFVTPLTHAGGCLILPVLLKRGICEIQDHFDPKVFLERVEKVKVTTTFIVPTMIYVLLDTPDLRKYDLSSLRNVIYGASAIAPARLNQAVDTLGPIFTQLFGQTESPMMISSLSRQEHVIADPERRRKIYASCGRPVITADVCIVDENGRKLPCGETGDIVCRTINMMTGYLKNPEQTAETIRDGWLWTGDVGKFDEEGYLYIVDRSKDMIISGGFNIFPREIEDVLHEHPAVKNVAVVGVPHEKWGEEVTAVVTLHEGQTVGEKELIRFVKEHKGSLMAPKSVKFWNEIPLTNLGKLDKKKIREAFWKGKDRKV
jgi:acyl-CoA synthetase (AMP-forming)/AMP-acid ligase II